MGHKRFYNKIIRSLFYFTVTVALTIILVEFSTGLIVASSFLLSSVRVVLLLIFILPQIYLLVFQGVIRYLKERETDEQFKYQEDNHFNMLREMEEGYSLHEVLFNGEGNPVDYRFLETNKEFEKQTGLHDVQGKLRSELEIEIVQKWIDVYGRVALTGIPEHIKYEAKHSGRYYDSYIFRTGNPESRKVAVFLNDITRLKESEKIQAHLSAIVKNSQESIISINLDGIIQTWNAGAENIYGYNAEEAVGKHIGILIPREKANEAIGITSKILQGENIDNYESLCLNKKGEIIPVSITISPIRDDEGKVIGMSKISHNISERKKAEEALIESERRWATTLASISEGVIATDNKGNITFVNAEAEHLTGWNKSETISHPVKDVLKILDEQTHQEIENPVEKAIKQGSVIHLNNHQLLVRKDGNEIAVEESVAPIKAEDGRTTGIVVVFHDVTERKISELRLKNYNSDLERMVAERTSELINAKELAESADQQKTNFLMTMSHELRTPLNSIIGFTGILLKEMAGPLTDEQKKQVKMVQTSGNQLLRLVNDILDMSRIEQGKVTINYEYFNIVKTIEDIIESEKPFAESKGLSIKVLKKQEDIQVESDPERIHQILLNVVHNALKFTERGSVKIECHADNEFVEIKVIDTGIGIAEENVDKIFTSFVQLDTGLIKKNQGTGSGLGLTICKKLLELLKGRIDVESEYMVGSTFTVFLPLRASDAKL